MAVEAVHLDASARARRSQGDQDLPRVRSPQGRAPGYHQEERRQEGWGWPGLQVQAPLLQVPLHVLAPRRRQGREAPPVAPAYAQGQRRRRPRQGQEVSGPRPDWLLRRPGDREESCCDNSVVLFPDFCFHRRVWAEERVCRTLRENATG
ncbi:uncharacterized protein RHTO_01515 [Rhodotorula toruloides NP11]|uniref:Uncharacterized protein n=1 Tax=Rhodotorula toruloides (strain NP11) TaxID=1130832 RepID=M7XNW2_RHOT1|nr:uncharacterized protein RHTO_01515 [Rhodotorula toruloides NP11]EMS21868.1 hypothetical protein RHTO_01515 [Rhodotorula toruloides NP11]